jgi:predicted metal-dependent hydrolase
MIEFFNNVWGWVVLNEDAILAFLTSSTFIATVTAIITIVKSIKVNSKNTVSVDSIKETISTNNSIGSEVSESKLLIENQKAEIEEIKKQNLELAGELHKFEDNVVSKLNSMLDLYSVVYSTLKDETIREAANSILMKAKYNTDLSKEQLNKDIEELKDKLSEKMFDIQNAVSETVDSVKDTVGITVTTENKLKRY